MNKVTRAKRAKIFRPETTPTIRKPHSRYSCQEAHTRLYRRIIDEREQDQRSERLYYQPLYDIFQVVRTTKSTICGKSSFRYR